MSAGHPVASQLNEGVFLTDGGLETCLVFLDGVDLPCFAAFPLLREAEGRERLERYFTPFLETAAGRGAGFILDTPTWRANSDWGAKLGYSKADIVAINREAVAWAKALRAAQGEGGRVLVNGVAGPRGDGYRVEDKMSAAEAEAYHAPAIAAFAEAGADMASAVTMNYAEEAIGIARAAKAAGLPVAISFTVETEGRLASGDSLREAIERVDAETGAAPLYYMVNCAHPSHFDHVLAGETWTDRIRGVRANASAKSHAELDAATELDIGDPVDLGLRYRSLRRDLRNLSIMGGCCGTDHRHIAAICEACLPVAA